MRLLLIRSSKYLLSKNQTGEGKYIYSAVQSVDRIHIKFSFRVYLIKKQDCIFSTEQAQWWFYWPWHSTTTIKFIHCWKLFLIVCSSLLDNHLNFQSNYLEFWITKLNFIHVFKSQTLWVNCCSKIATPYYGIQSR